MFSINRAFSAQPSLPPAFARGTIEAWLAYGRDRLSPAAVALSIALWASTPACGEVVNWLYEVEVPAESQTEAHQRRAARSALREMLTRMTGLKNVPMSQPIVEALNAPELYYMQYRFVQDGSDPDQRLQVSFEPQAIQDLVAEASLPIWSADRPRVLAWLAIREDGLIRVLDSGSDHPLADSLRQRSRHRGVPLTLPLMDLEDRELISPPAVWDGFAYTLDAASRRYGAEVVLVGRAAQIADDEWRTDWEFWIDNEPRVLSYSAENVEAGAAQAMDEVADELMQRLAVFGRDATAIEIAVRGAGSIGRYADLMRHLSNLEYIERVHLTAAEQETLTLRVVTRSTPERLAELLSKDGAFRRLPPMPGLGGIDLSDVTEDRSAAPLILLWSGKS